MDDDALVSSLREQVRAQEKLIADQAARLEALEAILSMFDTRISEGEARLRDAVRLARIAAGPPLGAPQQAPPRDRHGLRAVQGVAGMAMLAAAGRLKTHRLVAGALLAAVAGTTAAAGPSLTPLAPATGPPAAVAGRARAHELLHSGARDPARWAGVVLTDRDRLDRDRLDRADGQARCPAQRHGRHGAPWHRGGEMEE